MFDHTLSFSIVIGMIIGMFAVYAGMLVIVIIDSLIRRAQGKSVSSDNFKLGILSFVSILLLASIVAAVIVVCRTPEAELSRMRGNIEIVASIYIMLLLGLKGAITPNR